MLGAEARERLADRGDQPSLLQQRRTETGHQPAETVGLLGELLADLREDLDAPVAVAGLDHQERRLQRERRRGHALHRAVVEVASDAVALGLDRAVGPPEQPRPVLVAVLQELEERADRLVGDPAGGHVAHEQESPRRRHGHVGDARLQIERLPLGPLDGALPGRGERRERGSRLRSPTRRAPSTAAPRWTPGRCAPCCRTRRSLAGSRRDGPARRSRRRPPRRPAGDAPRIGGASRSSRAPVRAPRSASARARSLSPSACLASAWACVLRIWFARMRAATPSPSTAMIAVDCIAGRPSRVVEAGDGDERRARRDHGHAREDRAGQVQPPFVGLACPTRRGNTMMVAASAGPASMNTTTIPGKPTWNAPRVHSQPKTSGRARRRR